MTEQLIDDTAGDENAISVLADFATEGWTENNIVRPDGQIECGNCGVAVSADRVEVGAQHRIEGASDPDDMQLVLGTICPECSGRGAIVLGYGPNASEQDSEVMALVTLDDATDPTANPS